MKNIGHICNMDDKYCQEGADPDRHYEDLPVDHPYQHPSHKGGCICPLGYGQPRKKEGQKQYELMFRLPNTDEGRLTLKAMRKALNTNSYSIRTMFTGPRPKGTNQVSTLKENATSIRVYVTSKIGKE